MRLLFLFLFFLSCVSLTLAPWGAPQRQFPNLYIGGHAFLDLYDPLCRKYDDRTILVKEDGLVLVEMEAKNPIELECSLHATLKDENHKLTKLSLFQRRVFYPRNLKTIILRFSKGSINNEKMLASLRQDVIFEFICANDIYFCLETSLNISPESVNEELPDCMSSPTPEDHEPTDNDPPEPVTCVNQHSRFVPSVDYISVNNVNITEFNMFSSVDTQVVEINSNDNITVTVLLPEHKNEVRCSLYLQTDEQIKARHNSELFVNYKFLNGKQRTFMVIRRFFPQAFLSSFAGDYYIFNGHVICDYNVHYWFIYNVTFTR